MLLLGCIDSPIGWVDSEGDSCLAYKINNWCKPTGQYGRGWDNFWGTFADYEGNGKDASEACCDCGGGSGGVSLPGAWWRRLMHKRFMWRQSRGARTFAHHALPKLA